MAGAPVQTRRSNPLNNKEATLTAFKANSDDIRDKKKTQEGYDRRYDETFGSGAFRINNNGEEQYTGDTTFTTGTAASTWGIIDGFDATPQEQAQDEFDQFVEILTAGNGGDNPYTFEFDADPFHEAGEFSYLGYGTSPYFQLDFGDSISYQGNVALHIGADGQVLDATDGMSCLNPNLFNNPQTQAAVTETFSFLGLSTSLGDVAVEVAADGTVVSVDDGMSCISPAALTAGDQTALAIAKQADPAYQEFLAKITTPEAGTVDAAAATTPDAQPQMFMGQVTGNSQGADFSAALDAVMPKPAPTTPVLDETLTTDPVLDGVDLSGWKKPQGATVAQAPAPAPAPAI